MAKVLGFQIEINGTQRAISTSEELRRAIADIGKELKKATDVETIQKLEKELELKAKDVSESQIRDYLAKIESKRQELEIFIRNANNDMEKKEKEMLKPIYQKILDIGNGFELNEARISIGFCYEKLGKSKESVENLKTFLKDSPKSLLSNVVSWKVSLLEKL